MRVGLVWAMAEGGVIGRDGGLPWRLPDDLAHFKAVTLGCPVVMGRRTFASLGRPLPGRRNLVLSRTARELPGVETVGSLDEALARAQQSHPPWCWIIGGAAVYAAALPRADRLEITRVHAALDGDVRFPEVDWSRFERTWSRDHPADARHAYPFTFERWERRAGGSEPAPPADRGAG